MSYCSNILHVVNQCISQLLLIQKCHLYHISNIHVDIDILVGSLLCKIFNLSVFIPITHSLSYNRFMLNLIIGISWLFLILHNSILSETARAVGVLWLSVILNVVGRMDSEDVQVPAGASAPNAGYRNRTLGLSANSEITLTPHPLRTWNQIPRKSFKRA